MAKVKGIDCKYTINKEYFTMGSAYIITDECTEFLGILTDVTMDEVEFKMYSVISEDIDIVEKYTAKDIVNKNISFVKMIPDYENGKLDIENFNYI